MGLGPKWGPFWDPLFRTCGSLGPFGRVGFAQKGFWRGSKNGSQNGSENGAENGAILVSIFAHFRDLFANLPFLLKTHRAYTRALILRAQAFKIHHFWGTFSAPFLVPFWVPEMEAKWEPKWDPTKHKNRIFRILCPTLGAQGPTKRGTNNCPKNGPLKNRIFSENGTSGW